MLEHVTVLRRKGDSPELEDSSWYSWDRFRSLRGRKSPRSS